MPRVLLDSVVHTDHGILDLLWKEDGYWNGDVERFFAGQVNGLVGASNPHGVFLYLARMSGGSRVTVLLHDDEPAPDTAAWEDIVEVSSAVPQESLPTWQTFAGQTTGPLDLGPGSYRLRVSARGRDEARPGRREGESPDDVVDAYLVDAWLSPEAPDSIIQTVSHNAAGRHSLMSGSWDEAPGAAAAVAMPVESPTAQPAVHQPRAGVWARIWDWIRRTIGEGLLGATSRRPHPATRSDVT